MNVRGAEVDSLCGRCPLWFLLESRTIESAMSWLPSTSPPIPWPCATPTLPPNNTVYRNNKIRWWIKTLIPNKWRFFCFVFNCTCWKPRGEEKKQRDEKNTKQRRGKKATIDPTETTNDKIHEITHRYQLAVILYLCSQPYVTFITIAAVGSAHCARSR